jgi:hypothetical protein
MKVRCPVGGAILALCVVTFVMVPRPSMAAFGDPQAQAALAQRDAELLQTFSPGEIQKVRDQLDTITGDLLQIRTMIGHPAGKAESARFKSRAANLKDVDIARWLAAGVDLAPLQRDIENAMAKTAVAEIRSQDGAVTPATTAGFPGAQYGSACSGYTSNSDVVFGYQTALNTAKLVWVAADRACNEVVVVLGEGGNGSLVCIIADEILQAAELVLDEYTICDGDTQSAQVTANYDRLAYINGQIDTDYNATIANSNTNASATQANDNANRNTIVANDNANAGATQANDNANKNTIVANDNANKAAIISNDNANQVVLVQLLANTAAQLLKTQIETNLASSGPPVGYYELPAAKGGQLEAVRDDVAALIQTFQSSGMGVGSAATYLSQGNGYLASHQYKLAYARYRSAYQQATNPGY